jgi:hypothetical protein
MGVSSNQIRSGAKKTAGPGGDPREELHRAVGRVSSTHIESTARVAGDTGASNNRVALGVYGAVRTRWLQPSAFATTRAPRPSCRSWS